MLVLSRKKDESIEIGRDIVVTVVETRGDKVRLGIEAPRDIPVHRSEVAAAIRRANGEEPDEPVAPEPDAAVTGRRRPALSR